MIRINLLQVRATRERRKSSIATQLLVFFVLLAAEVAAFVFLQMRLSDRINVKQAEIDKIRGALNAKRSDMSDLDAKKKELDDINNKRKVIEALQAGRTGPTNLLAEVMRILSKNGGPTMSDATRRLVNQFPDRNFHRDWDYRRLWLTRIQEADREVTIEGSALDVEDIGEFQRRLNLSQYFDDVRWVSSPEATSSSQGDQSLYRFTLKGHAVYQ